MEKDQHKIEISGDNVKPQQLFKDSDSVSVLCQVQIGLLVSLYSMDVLFEQIILTIDKTKTFARRICFIRKKEETVHLR